MAVDNGWGGRQSKKKAEEFFAIVIERFRTAATLPADSYNDCLDSNELAIFMAEEILTRFSAELEDESDIEVAEILIDLFKKCAIGDFSSADEMDRESAVCEVQRRARLQSSSHGAASDNGSDVCSSELSDDSSDAIEDSKRNGLQDSSKGPKFSLPDDEGWSTVLPSRPSR